MQDLGPCDFTKRSLHAQASSSYSPPSQIWDQFKKETLAEQAKLDARITALEETGPSSGGDSKEAQLKKFNEEMKVMMNSMGTIVSIASSLNTDDNSVVKRSLHTIMKGMISTIENVYKWSDDRKRSLYESMQDCDPFKDALEKLDNAPPATGA